MICLPYALGLAVLGVTNQGIATLERTVLAFTKLE